MHELYKMSLSFLSLSIILFVIAIYLKMFEIMAVPIVFALYLILFIMDYKNIKKERKNGQL